MSTPQIYVACLASYNAGNLYGAWIDLEDYSFDPDEVLERVLEILEASPAANAEEFAIHDTNGLVDVTEYTHISEVCRIAEFIDTKGAAAFAAMSIASTFSDAEKLVENGYGVYDSLADYAHAYLDDLGLDIPNFIHIDYEASGRDLVIDCTTIRYDGDLYIFNS